MPSESKRSRVPLKPAIFTIVGVLLVLGMLLDTDFVNKDAAAAGQPGAFSAPEYASKNFAKITETITSKATDIATLAPAIDAGVATAGAKYGQDLGAGSYAFAVKATGTVSTVDANFAVLKVDGVTGKDIVRIPLGLALNGAPIRDCTGTIKYGDFNDQTQYQEVADELKKIVASKVLPDAKSLLAKGSKIDVVGAIGTGGPANAFSINPVTIKAGS